MGNTRLETVNVDGLTLCRDTKIVSQSDDWNAYNVQRLASTGTGNGLAAMLIAGILLLANAIVLMAAHRGGRQEHQDEADGGSIPSLEVCARCGGSGISHAMRLYVKSPAIFGLNFAGGCRAHHAGFSTVMQLVRSS